MQTSHIWFVLHIDYCFRYIEFIKSIKYDFVINGLNR